jgi:hypothetical protein
MEMKATEKKQEKYYAGQLGELPVKREDGTMRVLANQMGGLCKHGIKRDKNSGNRTVKSLLQHKYLRINGTQLQLDESEFISKSSIMVSRRRKRDVLHLSSQHE